MQRLSYVLAATVAVLALAAAAVHNPHQSASVGQGHILAKDDQSPQIDTHPAVIDNHDLPRVKRLTSFGRPSETAPTPKQGKSRECKNHGECGAIQHTLCLAEPRDGKKRCLCKDYSLPVNGFCKQINRGLYEKCDNDQDCLEGGECRTNGNATKTMAKNARICLCQQGRIEEKGLCSGSTEISNQLAMLFSAIALVMRFSLH